MVDSGNQDAAFSAGAASADSENRKRTFQVGLDKTMEGFQKPNTDVQDAKGKHITVRGGDYSVARTARKDIE